MRHCAGWFWKVLAARLLSIKNSDTTINWSKYYWVLTGYPAGI